MKITIHKITNWNRVLNAARMTVNKRFIDKEPSDEFKYKILLAEHSPIRLLEFDVIIEDIPYYVVMHLVRHFNGIEKFVETSREDRTGIKREERKQTDLINCQFSINAQALINISRKRMCFCADKNTRECWESIIEEISKIEPIIKCVCVPECIYRGFCPEINSCGYFKKIAYFNNRTEYLNNKIKYIKS